MVTGARETLQLRLRAYERERERGWVAAFGLAPLMVLYVLSHTTYLRPYVPHSKGLAVVVLILVPSAWFGLVMALHAVLGTRRHGLRCPACGARLVGTRYRNALDHGCCDRCGTALAVGPEPG